jgi:lipid-A-disaccharide synthase
MLEAVTGLSDYEIIVAGTAAIDDKVYQSLIGNHPVKLINGATYDIVKKAKAALVCSGTATLETALLNCPQVVCYKFGAISYWIGRMLIKVKYISLVNLILDKLAIPELIQQRCEPKMIQKTLLPLLKDSPERLKMIQDYAALKIKVGGEGASAKTGHLIAERTLPLV